MKELSASPAARTENVVFEYFDVKGKVLVEHKAATQVLYNIILKIIKLSDTSTLSFGRLTIHKGCQFSQVHW